MNQNEARQVFWCISAKSLLINFAVLFSATLSKGALAQNLEESGEIRRLGKTKAAFFIPNSDLNPSINLKSTRKSQQKSSSEIDFIRQSIEEKTDNGNQLQKSEEKKGVKQVESDDIKISKEDTRCCKI